MKKHRNKGEFDVVFLDKLVEDENSCVYLQTMQHHLALHPYHLRDLNNSVNDILSKGVGKFCKRLDGILCGFKSVKFITELGQICDDSCFIHFDIEADFFIFNPQVDKLVKGIVNKKSKDHVGCLVHNVFNVSLPKPKHSDCWEGESLELNSEVCFKIKYTNFDGKLPYIRGEIYSEEVPAKNKKRKFIDADDSPVEKKKKKNRKQSASEGLEDNSILQLSSIKKEKVEKPVEEEQKPVVKIEKVKKKKHKIKEEIIDDYSEN